MTTALVQIGDIPAMTLCAICPKPGNCCAGFGLYPTFTFWLDRWRTDAKDYATARDFPFEAQIDQTYTDPETGREYVTVKWNCPRLVDGRCSIYETRPQLCRDYIPGSCGICVFG